MRIKKNPFTSVVVVGRTGHWTEVERMKTKQYGTVFYMKSDEDEKLHDHIVTRIGEDNDMIEIGYGWDQNSSFSSICEEFDIL
jgi:hypothetical protein